MACTRDRYRLIYHGLAGGKLRGEVDYSLVRSVPIGIQSVVVDIVESFLANNLDAVKESPVLPQIGLAKRSLQMFLTVGDENIPVIKK